jgi:hypothetical protein
MVYLFTAADSTLSVTRLSGALEVPLLSRIREHIPIIRSKYKKMLIFWSKFDALEVIYVRGGGGGMCPLTVLILVAAQVNKYGDLSYSKVS